jgi:hypothetical protein
MIVVLISGYFAIQIQVVIKNHFYAQIKCLFMTLFTALKSNWDTGVEAKKQSQ